MTKPRKKSTKTPKALRPPRTPPPRLLPAAPSASPGRPRTAPLPGMEDDGSEEIRDLALKFFHLRDQKLSLGKKENAAKDALLEAMHRAKLKRFFDTEAQLLVEIEEAGEKLRVTVGKDQDER